MSRTIEANKIVHGKLISTGEYQKSPHRLPESKARLTDRLKSFGNLLPKNILHLDAGCGDGFVFECKPSTWRSTGIDVTEQMLAVCALNHPEIELHNNSVEEMPFDDEKFDIVTCYSFLDHLSDTKTFYAEAMRVLKPGGIFYFGLSPNRFFLNQLQLIEYVDTSIEEHGINVEIELKKAFKDGIYYSENFGLDPSDLADCEPGKSLQKGLDPLEEIKKLEECGSKYLKLNFEWIVQQNFLSKETIKNINEFLPLSSGCFKYFDIHGMKN